MILTIFRSRLMPGVDDVYLPVAARMDDLAASMPGYVAHKEFVADDGERLTLVAFDSEEATQAWRMHPEHQAAQRQGRDTFYSEYRIQVCKVLRQSDFKRASAA